LNKNNNSNNSDSSNTQFTSNTFNALSDKELYGTYPRQPGDSDPEPEPKEPTSGGGAGDGPGDDTGGDRLDVTSNYRAITRKELENMASSDFRKSIINKLERTILIDDERF